MQPRRLRYLLIMVLAFSAAGINGCDVLNPAFVGSIGGNPLPGAVEEGGSILVTLVNRTGQDATMTVDYDVRRPGTDDEPVEGMTILNNTLSPFTIALTCRASRIEISEISINGEPIPGTGAEFVGPALRCGSNIFVTVAGVAPNITVDAQLVN